MKHSGFTLSELLIALAILGLIATFTIPKVLQSTGNQSKEALLKELYASLSEIHYKATLEGYQGSDWSYFRDHLNNISVACPSDSSAEGCFTQTGPRNTESGFLLNNGVSIAGIDGDYLDDRDNFTVDFNGTEGPNTVGEDQLQLCFTFATVQNSHPAEQPFKVRPGECAAPACSSSAANTALYTSLFD